MLVKKLEHLRHAGSLLPHAIQSTQQRTEKGASGLLERGSADSEIEKREPHGDELAMLTELVPAENVPWFVLANRQMSKHAQMRAFTPHRLRGTNLDKIHRFKQHHEAKHAEHMLKLKESIPAAEWPSMHREEQMKSDGDGGRDHHSSDVKGQEEELGAEELTMGQVKLVVAIHEARTREDWEAGNLCLSGHRLVRFKQT
jgi:hypothetical protein